MGPSDLINFSILDIIKDFIMSPHLLVAMCCHYQTVLEINFASGFGLTVCVLVLTTVT